ncbi:MAG: T9SS type A sorting domain-containing protein [Chitinophagales bacterium]
MSDANAQGYNVTNQFVHGNTIVSGVKNIADKSFVSLNYFDSSGTEPKSNVVLGRLNDNGSISFLWNSGTQDTAATYFVVENTPRINSKNQLIIGGSAIRYADGSFYNFLDLFDTTGNIVFAVNVFDSNYKANYFYDFSPTDFNTTLVLNGLQRSLTDQKVRIRIYCFDSSGAILWTRWYPQPADADFVPQIIKPSRYGEHLVAGYTPLASVSPIFHPVVFYIDSSGNEIRRFILPDSIQGIASAVIDTSDQSMVFCSSWFDHSNTVDLLAYQPLIGKVGSTGVLRWHKKLTRPIPQFTFETVTTMFSIKKVHDGNYVAVGRNILNPEDTSVYVAGYLVKFSDESDSAKIIWERSYRALSNAQISSLYDIVEQPDGSLIACGDTKNTNDSIYQRGWIIKLDSFGCLVPGCQNDLGVTESTKELAEIRLSPNPTSNVLYFYVTGNSQDKAYDVAVSTIDGREVLEQSHITTGVQYILNTSTLSKGTYVLTLKGSSGVIARTFIKE